MKYVIRNLKSSFVTEKAVSVMIIFSILTSTMIIMFAIGFINHVEQKKKDEVSNNKSVIITVNDFLDLNFTKGEAIDILCDIDNEITKSEYSIDMGVVLEEDVYMDDPDIYLTPFLNFSLMFSIDNGKLTVPYDIDRWDDDPRWWYGGRLFTEEDFDSENLVCIARPNGTIYDAAYGKEENIKKTVEKYPSGKDEYYIGGKKYTCIGRSDGLLLPFVPVTTVDDESYVTEIGFRFEKAISKTNYDIIYNSFKNRLGNKVQIGDIEFSLNNSYKFYNTLIAIAGVLSIIAGLIVSMLYEYILIKRRKTMVIMRLCGLSKGKICIISYIECMILFLTSYVLSVVIYHWGILPLLISEFEYISASMNTLFYARMGMTFLSIISVFTLFKIIRSMDNQIATNIKKL